MRSTTILSLLLLACAAAAAPDGPRGRLELRAEPATVNATETKKERRLVTLPALEFPLRLQPDCAAGTTLDYVSVTAADTRLIFRAADFVPGEALETTLRLPGEQLAPLGLDTACDATDPAADEEPFLVPAAFSAHASLLCTGDTGREMIYATLALAIRLLCAPAAQSPQEAAADQASSAGATSF
jgi:hypothetical protein